MPLETLFARPEVAERVRAVRTAMGRAQPLEMPGPRRDELLALVG